LPNREPLVYTSQDYVAANDGTSLTLMLSENNNVPMFAPALVAPSGLSGGPASWGNPTSAAYEKQCNFVWWPDKSPDPAVRINAPDAHSSAQVYYYYFLHPASMHPGGVNASFCDGHVRFLSQDIEYFVFCLLMSPEGKQCNTAGTTGGLDGQGGTPYTPAFYHPNGDNYTYLRTVPLDESRIP
jgi:prepilin-type processing-associated H-X9-DG protein